MSQEAPRKEAEELQKKACADLIVEVKEHPGIAVIDLIAFVAVAGPLIVTNMVGSGLETSSRRAMYKLRDWAKEDDEKREKEESKKTKEKKNTFERWLEEQSAQLPSERM